MDSLGYIEKTEDGLFTGKVFNNIKKIGKDLAPCLIEKLKDTTSTDYRYADFCNFSTGDFALFMLPYTLDKENDESNIYKDVIIKEFGKKYPIKDMFYQDIQTTLFHLHDKKTNYKNRLKLHKKLKKWYLKKYKKLIIEMNTEKPIFPRKLHNAIGNETMFSNLKKCFSLE